MPVTRSSTAKMKNEHRESSVTRSPLMATSHKEDANREKILKKRFGARSDLYTLLREKLPPHTRLPDVPAGKITDYLRGMEALERKTVKERNKAIKRREQIAKKISQSRDLERDADYQIETLQSDQLIKNRLSPAVARSLLENQWLVNEKLDEFIQMSDMHNLRVRQLTEEDEALADKLVLLHKQLTSLKRVSPRSKQTRKGKGKGKSHTKRKGSR